MKFIKIISLVLIAFFAVNVIKINASDITGDITVVVDSPYNFTAGPVTPNTAYKNIPQTFSAYLINIGTQDYPIPEDYPGELFYFFQIKNLSTGNIIDGTAFSVTDLSVSNNKLVTANHTFTENGNYSVRVCVDKKSSTIDGGIRETVESDNCGGDIDTANVTVTTQVTIPTVTTAVVSNITKTSAVSGGSVTSDGGAPVTSAGIVWHSVEPFDVGLYTGRTQHDNWADYSAWSDDITGLECGTDYYVKAYATNDNGSSYGYGEVIPFTTSSCESVPDLKITAWQNWSGNGRDTVWGGYENIDGPVELYDADNYQLSWGAVPNAVSCTLDGTPVSVSGGTINTYTANFLSKTHTLTCKNSANQSYSDSIEVSVPGAPLTFVSSCAADGNSVTLNWTLPTGYTDAYVRPAVAPFYYDTTAGEKTITVSITPDATYSGIYLLTRGKTNYSWGPGLAVNGNGNISCPSLANLTASVPPQGTAVVGIPQNFTSTIKNNGGTLTSRSFYNLFQVMDIGGNLLYETPTTLMYPIGAGAIETASIDYPFDEVGDYMVRFCADKTSSVGGGLITESEENDNCSFPNRTVTVRLPTILNITPSPTSYHVARNTPVSITYTVNTETGNEAECRLLDNYKAPFYPYTYQAESDGALVRNAPASPGDYAYYIQCRDIDVPLAEAISPLYPTPSIHVYVKPIVTFNKNGGTTEANPTTKTTNWGTAIGTLPTAPTRDGYVFDGWNTENPGSGTGLYPYTTITNDITVYAQWTVIDYTVSTSVLTNGVVNGAGGSISPTSKTVSYGGSTSFTITPTVNRSIIPNIEYGINTVTGCSGNRVGNVYTTGTITNSCTVTVNFVQMTGDITPNSPTCEIPTGSGSCDLSLSWSTVNPIGTSALTSASLTVGGTNYPAVNKTVSSASVTVPYGNRVFSLYNNGSELDQVTAVANCNATTDIWNGSICIKKTYSISTSVMTDGVVSGVGGTISPTSKVVNHGDTALFTMTPTVVTPTTGYITGAVTASGCMVSQFDSVNVYITGAITSNCTVTVNFRKMTGDLSSTVNSCTIPAGSSSCTVPITWSVANPIVTPNSAITASSTTNPNYTAVNYSAVNTGGTNSSFVVPYDHRTFYLYNNSIELDQIAFTSACVSGSKWDGYKCITGTLSASASSCDIPAGASSCPVTLTWDTQYETNTSAITAAATTNPDYPAVNFSGNSGPRSFDVPYSSRTFFLYNTSQQLASTTVSSDCAFGSAWSPVDNKCIKNQYLISTVVQVNGTPNNLGGTIAPENASINYGEYTDFMITPYEGYSLLGVTGCGGTLSGNLYTTGGITSACTVTANFKPIMSGTLTRASSSCIIPTIGSECPIILNWSIKNPEVTPTAITGTNGFYQDVSTSLTPTTQSGTLSVPIPYTYSPRSFFLYNNGEPYLASLHGLTSSCDTANGYIWGTSVSHCILSSHHISTERQVDGVTTITEEDAGGTIAPIEIDVLHGSSTTFTVVPKSNIYAIASVTGCGGNFVGSTYTTGAITSDCTVVANFKKMIGDLTPNAPSCEITLDNNSCTVPLSWIVTNPLGATTEITSEGMTPHTSPSVSSGGPTPFTVVHGVTLPGSRIFYLYNNAALLDQVTAIAECDADTTWNGTVCARSAGTITADDCVIGQDSSSCDVTLNWTTVHPITISQVTTPEQILVAEQNNGRTYYELDCSGYSSVNECERPFFLYNGGDPELDRATAKASCSPINKWSADERICKYQSPILTLSASSCTIPLDGSSCVSTLTWSTEYSDEISVLKKGSDIITTANSSAGYPYSLPAGSHTFSLSNKETTVYAYPQIKCTDFTHWDITTDKCIIDPPSPENITFTAVPSIILPNKSSTLSWDASSVIDTSKGDTCSISDTPASETTPVSTVSVGSSGTKVVTPEETTTYTLTCQNSSGDGDSALLIKVVSITVKEN